MNNQNQNPETTIGTKKNLTLRWLVKDPEGTSLRDKTLQILQEKCRKGSRERPFEFDLRGINLVRENLSGLDLSNYDLTEADLTGSNLSGSILSRCNLSKASLTQAIMDHCECLGADLSGANLNECHAERAGFGAANLTGATFFGAKMPGVSLSNSNLEGADFRTANLTGAHIRQVNLTDVNFTRANLAEVDFEESNVKKTRFTDADLRKASLRYIKNFKRATWIRADIRSVDFCGAYMVRRFIMDENYLFEFRTHSKYNFILYYLWWLSSDCGRSILRWTVLIWINLIFFSLIYRFVDIDYGEYETALSPLYFSLVTFTTLGYGDNIPASLPAQVIAGLEVILGYVALGGLLSILANKIARRSD